MQKIDIGYDMPLEQVSLFKLKNSNIIVCVFRSLIID